MAGTQGPTGTLVLLKQSEFNVNVCTDIKLLSTWVWWKRAGEPTVGSPSAGPSFSLDGQVLASLMRELVCVGSSSSKCTAAFIMDYGFTSVRIFLPFTLRIVDWVPPHVFAYWFLIHDFVETRS